MQAKRPIRHLSRRPDDLCVLPRHLGRVGLASSQKIKIKHAADDVILERSIGTIRIRTKLDVHAGRAEEKDGVRAAPRTGPMLKVHRVAPVQVRAARDAIRVARPQRPRRVDHVEAERLRVLSEAVDVRVARQRRLEAEELRLKDERYASSR